MEVRLTGAVKAAETRAADAEERVKWTMAGGLLDTATVANNSKLLKTSQILAEKKMQNSAWSG